MHLSRAECLYWMDIDTWQQKPSLPVPPKSVGAWETLSQAVASCTACPLHCGRTQTVFGRGSQHARLMVIGEAPGFHEDKQGQPFVGRAGKLLDAMLAALNFTQEDVYIANILKCRPPGNRDPQPEEVATCTPFLSRQIDLLQPQLLLAAGRIAAQFLLGTQKSLGQLRQNLHVWGDRRIPLVVTYHPAYLLRNPADKRKALADLSQAARLLTSLQP